MKRDVFKENNLSISGAATEMMIGGPNLIVLSSKSLRFFLPEISTFGRVPNKEEGHKTGILGYKDDLPLIG